MKSRNIYIIALVTCLLDQFTKYLVSGSLSLGSSKSLGSPMQLTLVHNYGGAFGVLQSNTLALSLITLVVIAMIVVYSRKHSALPLIVGIALSQALGGALGNLIDRIRLGYVVDFVDFRVWPVFNIADVAVTGGVILLAYHLLFHDNPMAVKES